MGDLLQLYRQYTQPASTYGVMTSSLGTEKNPGTTLKAADITCFFVYNTPTNTRASGICNSNFEEFSER